RRRHCGRSFRCGRAGNGAMLEGCHAPGGGDGGNLSRDSLGPAALGMARPYRTCRAADLAEAVAGVAPRVVMRGVESAGGVHVVGGGLAGLAAAVALADSGRSVILYE